MSKPRMIKSYEKLSEELIEQIKLVYPRGFEKHLIAFQNRDGDKNLGLPLETEDHIYLIRMTKNKAASIISDDDDYDENGRLKKAAKSKYEEKHDDLDYLEELNSNDDNDFVSSDETDLDQIPDMSDDDD